MGGVGGCSIRSDRLGVQEVTQSRELTHRHAFKSLDVCGLEFWKGVARRDGRRRSFYAKRDTYHA